MQLHSKTINNHKIRENILNHTVLASIALQYGFHNYLIFSSQHIQSALRHFVLFENDNAKYYSSWDHENSLNDGVENVCPPKILGDVFKAVAGAIYLDTGLKLDSVWKVYRRMMENKLQDLSRNIPQSPIEEIQELFPHQVTFQKAVQKDRNRFSVWVEVPDFGR